MKNFLNRRNFVKTSAIGTIAMSSKISFGQESSDYRVYVGTYAPADAEGIFLFDYHSSTGKLTKVKGFTGGGANNSFIAISPDKQLLFAVSEDGSGGQLASFKIDQKSGSLSYINSVSAEGRGPCYVTIDQTGKWLLAANYGSGNVCIVPIGDDGTLKPASDVHQHEGSSVNERRQNGPHAHAIMVDANNQYVYSPNLGIDKIMIYKIDSENGKLIPNDPAYVETPAGSGPRHFAFHPNGKNAYGILELSSEIAVYDYDSQTGALKEKQVISTLPDDFEEGNSCADIHVSPDGNFVYGSNRGHNSLSIFSVAEDGTLTLKGHQSTHGETPRNFGIEPEGNHIITANQNTDNLVVFQVNKDNGQLNKVDEIKEIPKPVCVKFVKK